MVRCRRLFYYFNGRHVSHQIKASTRRNGFHKKECTGGCTPWLRISFINLSKCALLRKFITPPQQRSLWIGFYISISVMKELMEKFISLFNHCTNNEEILNRKLYFLCSVWDRQVPWDCLSLDCYLASLKYFGICNTSMMKRFCRNLFAL